MLGVVVVEGAGVGRVIVVARKDCEGVVWLRVVVVVAVVVADDPGVSPPAGAQDQKPGPLSTVGRFELHGGCRERDRRQNNLGERMEEAQ